MPLGPIAHTFPYLSNLNFQRLPAVNGILSAGNVNPVSGVGSVTLIRNALSGGD